MTEHHELLCCPISVSYDFEERMGLLIMPKYECVDMDGCVAFFERIDPAVRQIQTVAGDELDTVYTRTATGWDAA